MKENMEFIKKEDLKETITDIMNDTYIHKDKVCELLQKFEWADEKNWERRCSKFWNELCDELVGRDYYERWCMYKRWSMTESDR